MAHDNAAMARTLVSVNAQGRVTLPAGARRKLRLHDGSQLEVAVDRDRITLRPVQMIPGEDAWAYTAESLASIRRGLEDIRAGRVYGGLTEEDLLKGRFPRRKRASAPRRRSA